MAKVPNYNNMPLKTIYNAGIGPISLKQKNYILILCERRKLPKPDLSNMTKKEAAVLISNMVNS